MSNARPAADPAAGRARAAGNAVAALSLSSQEAGAGGAVISRKEWLVERRAAAAAATAAPPAAAAAPAAATGAVSVGPQHQSVLRTSPGGRLPSVRSMRARCSTSSCVLKVGVGVRVRVGVRAP